MIGRIIESRDKEEGVFEAIELEGGEEIALDHLRSVQGACPTRSWRCHHTLLASHVVTAAREGAAAVSAMIYEPYEKDKNVFQVQDSVIDAR